MSSAHTGYQQIHRKRTKEERLEFGHTHAPAAVNPPKNVCDVCGNEVVAVLMLDPTRPHVCQPCIDAYVQWNEVKALVRDCGRPSQFVKCDGCGVDYHYEVVHILDGSIFCHKCHDAAKGIGYDPTCGMKSDAEFLLDIWEQWMKLEVEMVANLDSWTWGHAKAAFDRELGTDFKRGFEYIVDNFLASHHWPRLLAKDNLQHVIVADDMWGWFVMKSHDWFARRRYPAKFTVNRPAEAKRQKPMPSWVEERIDQIKAIRGPESLAAEQRWHNAQNAAMARRGDVTPERYRKPVILPQQLQSNSEALEAIAMSKLPVSPAKIDELLDAVQVAIKEWNTNADARILPDGYYLYGKPECMIVPIYIYLIHPSHPNRVLVGEMSIMTDKDTHSELEFVSSRGEIREYMLKVAAGMKESNPRLPGVLMQAPYRHCPGGPKDAA
ncbi:MAG: hypothetical protein JXB07_18795 [Anaerolineae bacterium]|nr:hypothetical protein [Anaerolineae bacterium]